MSPRIAFALIYWTIQLLILSNSGSSQSAWGATYYVATTGSDSNPGTSSQPFRTIQKAANIVRAGDTVNVMPGNYTSVTSNASGTASARIRFVSTTRWGAKLTSSGSSTWQNTGHYVDIDGFDVTGGSTVRYGILNWASNVRVLNNHVHDITLASTCTSNGGAGIDHAGASTLLNNDTIGNLVHHIGLSVCEASPGAHGIYQATSGGVIAKNTVYSIDSHGIHVYKTGATPGANLVYNNVVYNTKIAIGTYWGEANKVYNNVLYNNSEVGIRTNAKDSLIANNTIYNTSGPGIWVSNSGNTFKNNILYLNNLQNDSTNTLSNNLIGIDPKFANAAAGDFRLQAGSPALDAGTTISEVTTDLNGVARPKGSAYDIGAYEYNASGTALLAPTNLAVTP